MFERLCDEAAQAGQEEPGEKNQGYGDLVSVKLGQELPYRDKLYGDGGYPRPNNG